MARASAGGFTMPAHSAPHRSTWQWKRKIVSTSESVSGVCSLHVTNCGVRASNKRTNERMKNKCKKAKREKNEEKSPERPFGFVFAYSPIRCALAEVGGCNWLLKTNFIAVSVIIRCDSCARSKPFKSLIAVLSGSSARAPALIACKRNHRWHDYYRSHGRAHTQQLLVAIIDLTHPAPTNMPTLHMYWKLNGLLYGSISSQRDVVFCDRIEIEKSQRWEILRVGRRIKLHKDWRCGTAGERQWTAAAAAAETNTFDIIIYQEREQSPATINAHRLIPNLIFRLRSSHYLRPEKISI